MYQSSPFGNRLPSNPTPPPLPAVSFGSFRCACSCLRHTLVTSCYPDISWHASTADNVTCVALSDLLSSVQYLLHTSAKLTETLEHGSETQSKSSYVWFEDLTTVVMKSSVLWDTTSCIPLKVNRLFLEHLASIFNSEDMLLPRNVCRLLTDYTA
jgi:hypothetical protein